MSRTKTLLICLMAVTICVATVALAKAVERELVDADGNQVGKAVLNYAKGADKTEIQVNCWDLDAEADYAVDLYVPVDDDYEAVPLGSFTTEKNGKGQLHARVDGDGSNGWVVVGSIDPDGFVVPKYFPPEHRLHPFLPVPDPGAPYLPPPDQGKPSP